MKDEGRKRLIARILLWLVPVIGAALVLFTSYQAVTTRRFEAANGVAGELLSGNSVGQTFVARYDGLSGVELHLGTYLHGTGPAKASLVLHLRENPPSVPLTDTGQLTPFPFASSGLRFISLRAGSSQPQDPANRDLATVRLPGGTSLAENPWYLFSFPSIPDSQDRTFYVEVESPDGAAGRALTLFWWQPDSANPLGDPYADGAAYRNGRPQHGDLAFALHYEASPISAAMQVARAMSVNLPGQAILLLFGGAAVAAGALLYLLATLREPEQRRRWLRRWSLPFALGVALLSGLLYLFLVPPWQGPDEHAHFAYTAMLDHYDLDYARVQNIYLRKRVPDKELVDSINASMARHNFTRLISSHPAPGSPPDAGATIFTALGKPPAYYWLGAMALRAARTLGISADPYVNPETSLLVVRGVSLVLGMVIVALAWLAARLISPDSDNWLILLLPLTVALLPMHTFDFAIFENDVLAEVAVSALFVVLIALLRRPTGWRAVALAVLAVLLTAGGLFTKPTASAALPLLAGGLLVWIGLLVTRALDRRVNASKGLGAGRGLQLPAPSPQPPNWVDSRHRAMVVPGAMGGIVALLAIASLLLAYQPQDQTAGWVTSWVPLRPMPRTATPAVRDGRFVLELGPKGYQVVTAAQVLLPPVYHPALKVKVTGWVRVAPKAGKPLVVSPTAVLRIEQGTSLMARTDAFLDPGGTWQPIDAGADIEGGMQQIVLRITSSSQRAQFDDFALHVDDGPVEWNDPVFRPTLLNPSAESGFLGLRPELAGRLPFSLVAVAEVLPNPQPFDKVALWGQYANGQYTSFWGNFGWLSISLPDSLYIALALIIVLALVGLVVRVVRRWSTSTNGGWGTVDWLGLVALFSLVATLAATYSWQMAQLATRSLTAGLSGRYLFVLIIPIAWLLLAGLGEITSLALVAGCRLRPSSSAVVGRRGTTDNRQPTTDNRFIWPWAVWIYVVSLSLFAAYCLLALIVPYYYG